MGFAIPSRSAQTVIDRLVNNDQRRPDWIGVKLQQFTPAMAQALGMKHVQGSIVANLAPGGRQPRRVCVPATSFFISPVHRRPINGHCCARSPAHRSGRPSRWYCGVMVRNKSLDIPVQEWPRRQWDGLDMPASIPHHQIPSDLGIALAALDNASRAVLVWS